MEKGRNEESVENNREVDLALSSYTRGWGERSSGVMEEIFQPLQLVDYKSSIVIHLIMSNGFAMENIWVLKEENRIREKMQVVILVR